MTTEGEGACVVFVWRPAFQRSWLQGWYGRMCDDSLRRMEIGLFNQENKKGATGKPVAP
jgi:hypothetical protein